MTRLPNNAFYSWTPMSFSDIELEELEKAGDGTPKRGRIRGVISSESPDVEGEVIVQEGVNWDYFVSHGKITDGHPATNDNVIGEPVSLERKMLKGGIPATVCTADLFLTDPRGQACWNKIVRLQKAGAKKGLGWSVEGFKLARDPNDFKRVTKSYVMTAALDPRPINTDSWVEAMAKAVGGHLARAGIGSLEEWVAAGCPLEALAKAAESAPALSTDLGFDRSLLDGLTADDLLVARTLRRMPHLTRESALAVARGLVQHQHQRSAA